jgi:hypothetical protein
MHGKKNHSSRITMHYLYKIHKKNGSHLSYREYIQETRNVCARILGYPEIVQDQMERNRNLTVDILLSMQVNKMQ